MFTFFGLFADPISDLPRQISGVWPDLKLIELQKPILAIAGRFGEDRYVPSDEDIPEGIVLATERLSSRISSARFLLLRTECWGGDCANWGQIIRDGRTAFQADGDGALRRLIGYWGVDIGPREIFEPLSRSFNWG
ncbi:hypothetical protein [Bradyrhizobium sp. CCBAU 45389]|uniref:hypothetical protein n=1 Tax=Bradyrhizobium sp. CCBAU 45389 TaxID=858429 RepID=UPI00230646F2|nr:hypothetical protein [Bradyrhizobium sp. CCBAU 45389]MDA9401862.1 hypothetical protein [Bradyrhizobium sp. CCBAU 45389]